MSSRLAWACAVLLAAGPASANLAASRPDPAMVSDAVRAAGAPGEASLQVVAESLTFDCRQEGGAPVCDFEARYTFQNPAPRYATVLAAFYAYRARDVHVLQDGAPIDRPLTAEQERELDTRVQAVAQRGGAADPRMASVTRTGAAISAIPDARVEIQVTGTIVPGRFLAPGYARPATHARHLLLGANPPPSDRFDLDYLIAPLRTWGPAPRIRVQVRHPERWQVKLLTSGRMADPADARSERRGATVTQQLAIDGARVDWLSMSIELPRGLQHGGLLLGLGANLDDSGGWRGRLAWEVAAPGWLFYSLGADTNFRDDLVLTPLLELATPSFAYVFPSLGAGLGIPVRIRPDVHPGARAQLTIQWPLLGLVTWLDYYPQLGSAAPTGFQLTLLGQLAL